MRSLFKTTAGKATCCAILLVALIVPSTAFVNAGSSDTQSVRTEQVTTTTIDPGPSQEDIDKLNTAIWVNKTNETILWIELTNQKIWIDNTNARLAAEEAARERKAEQASRQAAPRASANTPGNGRCGGNLPPCCVMQRESGGNITAQNPTSSASGKWQVISSTWNGYMGYPSAASAPEWVQDQFAAQLWAGGAGSGHWGGGC